MPIDEDTDVDNAAIVLMMMSTSIDRARIPVARNRLFASMLEVFNAQRETARREIAGLRAICAAQAAEISALRRSSSSHMPGS